MRRVCLTCKKEYTDDLAACPDDGGDLVPVMQDPMIGTVIADKYELLSVLGVGGMSTIYKGRHKYMGRLAAVKLLHPYLVADTSMFQRFQYEARAASNLNHPNVVGVYDFGITDGGTAYLVMDYLEGEDLASILEKQSFLTEAQAREIFKQACAGLDHAHSKGVIHRDLKPSNLFLMPEGENGINVKLVDFGIAKITDPDKDGIESGQNLTRTGEVFGSPLYMSPEQCSGRPLDARSDLYSLGCLMYETLTGRRPIVGATAIDTMHKHLKEPPMPFKEAAPTLEISPQLEAAVLKCLAKKPDDRFASVADFYKEAFGEELPRGSAALRVNSPSVNLKIQTKDDSGINTGDFNFGPGLTGANINSNTTVSKLGLPGGMSGTQKLHRWILPGSAVILICTGVAIAFSGYILFVWDGPATDHGKQIDRWRYTYHLSNGENQIAEGRYVEAEQQLTEAENLASKFGDNFGRTMNVYRAELSLFRKSNQYDKQAAVIAKMTQVSRHRAHSDFDTAMKEVARIDDILKEKKQGITHLGKRELEMQLSAVIDGIRDIAGRLGAVQDFDHQELLLTRTIATYSQLVADDDPQLAALDLDLAESHVNQDEFAQARPLLKQSLETYKLARANKREKVNDLDVAIAWMRIGQFDRDRRNYKDAEIELNHAYEGMRKFGQRDHAGDDGGRGNKYLIECLNALADYKDQVGKKDEADRFRQEAVDARKIRRELKIGVND